VTEEQLLELVEEWDEREYEEDLYGKLANDPGEHNDRKDRENRHNGMFEKLVFLEKHFFKEYDLNQPQCFMEVFLRWIEQFNGKVEGVNDGSVLSSENRYAFILAHKIIFFGRNQIISLLKEVWDNIKRELLMLAAKQDNVSPIDLMFKGEPIFEQLNASAFVPLSDSSHFQEFRHHCLPSGGFASIVIPCFDRLCLPLELKNKDLMNRINKMYGDKKNLFILEDFSGSGTSIEKNVKLIIENYMFENIYFCPCIISDKAEERLEELEKFARGKGKMFKVLYGIHMGKSYSISDDDSDDDSGVWQEQERKALQEISKKYFESHFKENKYLYLDHYREKPEDPTPFGFRNCGLAIALYTNCPNNSLPIIWSENGGWKPLFRRNERFQKRLNDE